MPELVKCIEPTCGKEFTITDGEIDFYKKKEFDLPKRCTDCRRRRKIERERQEGGDKQ